MGQNLGSEIFSFLHAYTRRLADNDDSFLVGQVEHLFRVRIMRSAETIASQPLEQTKVAGENHLIEPLATQVGILVFSQASVGSDENQIRLMAEKKSGEK